MKKNEGTKNRHEHHFVIMYHEKTLEHSLQWKLQCLQLIQSWDIVKQDSIYSKVHFADLMASMYAEMNHSNK